MNELETYAEFLPAGYMDDVRFWAHYAQRKRELRERMARRAVYHARLERRNRKTKSRRRHRPALDLIPVK